MGGLLVNTLLLVVAVLVVVLPLGTVVAWLLTRVTWPGRTVIAGLLILLLFTPLYLQAAAWDAGFGRQGWLTYQRGTVHQAPLRGWWAVIFLHTIHALPWAIVMIAAGFRHVEAAFEEQVLLDRPWWSALGWTSLRRASGAIFVAGAWVAVMVAGEMTVTDMYQVRTFAEELYTGLALGDDLGSIVLQLAPGWLLIAGLAAAVAAGMRWWLPVRTALPLRPTGHLDPGRARWGVAFAVGAVVLPLAAVPTLNLLYQAGLAVQRGEAGPLREWSAAKCLEILYQTPGRYWEEWWGTTKLATSAATLALAAGLTTAWWAREGSWRAALVFGLAGLAVALPGPLAAVLLLRLRDWAAAAWLDPLYDHGLVVAAVLALRSWPVCLAIAWQRFRAIPPAQLELATLDGLGPWRCLISVVLPQSRAALVMLACFAWALAAGDLATSILLAPVGTATVSIRIFLLVHAGVDDRLAGLTLVSAGWFAALAGVAAVAYQHHRSDRFFSRTKVDGGSGSAQE